MTDIKVREHTREFAEDKDVAAGLREEELRPALERGETVRLDFDGVTGDTRSFVHAMVSDLTRRQGPDCLDRMDFANCSDAVKPIVEIVCEYSQYEVPEST